MTDQQVYTFREKTPPYRLPIEVGKPSDQDLARLPAFIRALSEEHVEASALALAAESAFSKDWAEDAAWADL